MPGLKKVKSKRITITTLTSNISQKLQNTKILVCFGILNFPLQFQV